MLCLNGQNICQNVSETKSEKVTAMIGEFNEHDETNGSQVKHLRAIFFAFYGCHNLLLLK